MYSIIALLLIRNFNDNIFIRDTKKYNLIPITIIAILLSLIASFGDNTLSIFDKNYIINITSLTLLVANLFLVKKSTYYISYVTILFSLALMSLYTGNFNYGLVPIIALILSRYSVGVPNLLFYGIPIIIAILMTVIVEFVTIPNILFKGSVLMIVAMYYRNIIQKWYLTPILISIILYLLPIERVQYLLILPIVCESIIALIMVILFENKLIKLKGDYTIGNK